MKASVWLAVGLLLIPAFSSAAEKKGKDKRAPGAPVVKLSPGEAAVQKAREQMAAGQIDLAKRILDEATQAQDMTGEPFLLLAQILEPTAEWERALVAYKTAGEKLTGSAKGEALGRLSLLQDLNHIADATANADAAVAADPEGAWPKVALARQRVRQKRADEALALAQQAVAANVGAAAQVAVGLAQETRGDLAAAEAAYRAGLAVDANDVTGLLGLARVLRLTNRVADAAPLLKSVQDKAPWLSDGYTESVRVKMALGQFVEALEDANTFAVLSADNPAAAAAAKQLVDEVRIARALDDVRKGQASLAIDDLKKLRDEAPRTAAIRVGLARAYVETREIDPAIAELNKALELDANNAEAHFQLGLVQHEIKNNAAAALVEYEKAVALDPQNIQYRVRFGNVLAAQGQGARGIAELTKVVEGPGANNAEAWTYLIGAYLGAQRYKEAADTGRRALTLIGEQPSTRPLRALACGYTGWAYLNLSDADNFKKYGAMARDLGYDNKDFLDRLRRVEGGEALASAAKAPPAKARPRPRPRR